MKYTFVMTFVFVEGSHDQAYHNKYHSDEILSN